MRLALALAILAGHLVPAINLRAAPNTGMAWPPAWSLFEIAHASPIVDMRPLPDGSGVLAGMKDNTVVILSPQDGSVKLMSPPFKALMRGVEVIHGQNLAAVGTGRGLHILSLPDLTTKLTVLPRQSFYQFALSPDGSRVLLATGKNQVSMAEVAEGATAVPLAPKAEFFGWLPDSRHYVLLKQVPVKKPEPYRPDHDKVLAVFDSNTHQEVARLAVLFSPKEQYFPSRDGKWLIGANRKGQIDFWSVEEIMAAIAAGKLDAEVEPRCLLQTLSPLYIAMFRDLVEWTWAGVTRFDPNAPVPLPYIPTFEEGNLSSAILADGTVFFTKPNKNLVGWQGHAIDFGPRWTKPLDREEYQKRPPEKVPGEVQRDHYRGHEKFGNVVVDAYRVIIEPGENGAETATEIHINHHHTGKLIRSFRVPQETDNAYFSTAWSGDYALVYTGKPGTWPRGTPHRPKITGLTSATGDRAPSLFILEPGKEEVRSDDIWLTRKVHSAAFSLDDKYFVAMDRHSRESDPLEVIYFDMTRLRAAPPQRIDPGAPWLIRPMNNGDLLFTLRQGGIVRFQYDFGVWKEAARVMEARDGTNKMRHSHNLMASLLFGSPPYARMVATKDLQDIGWFFPYRYIDDIEWKEPAKIRVITQDTHLQDYDLPGDMFVSTDVFAKNDQPFTAIAVSPDGKLIAGASHKEIEVFEYKTTKHVASIPSAQHLNREDPETKVKVGNTIVKATFINNERIAISDGSNWMAWTIHGSEDPDGRWKDIDRLKVPVDAGLRDVKFVDSPLKKEHFYVEETFRSPRFVIHEGGKKRPMESGQQGNWLQLPGEDAMVYSEHDQMWLLKLPGGEPIHVWDIPQVWALGYNPHTREVITSDFQGFMQKWKLPPR